MVMGYHTGGKVAISGFKFPKTRVDPENRGKVFFSFNKKGYNK